MRDWSGATIRVRTCTCSGWITLPIPNPIPNLGSACSGRGDN
jgi:hypothetical protein